MKPCELPQSWWAACECTYLPLNLRQMMSEPPSSGSQAIPVACSFACYLTWPGPRLVGAIGVLTVVGLAGCEEARCDARPLSRGLGVLAGPSALTVYHIRMTHG